MNISLSDLLKVWYAENQRELPWRETRNPYYIWLSEVILQQTRVEQGRDYYLRFITRFPTIADLANATEGDVLKLWQGLGYYSRARNLHQAAKSVVELHGGKFPATHAEILSLKGVGSYTAAAIASLAFDLPHAVVDGNVFRVLARLFAIDTPIDSTAGKKQFAALAHELLDAAHAADHNQAMMELGALVCTPRQPDCVNCPVQAQCAAFASGNVSDFPVKSKKQTQRDRYFQYLVVREKDEQQWVWLKKRTGKGIWQNLYEFPVIETESAPDRTQFPTSPSWMELLGTDSYRLAGVSESYKHILSHQRIHACFWEVELDAGATPALDSDCIKVAVAHVSNFAVPTLIDNYLKDAAWS